MAATGTKNGNAKLTEDLVRQVRRLYYWDLLTQREIGRRLSLSQSAVSKIVNWKVWAHVQL